jgi:putative transposase
MTREQSALTELLDAIRAGGDLDVVRSAVEVMLQALIDLEATQAIGADRYERSDARTTYRNGTRQRLLSTKAGDVELAIPRLRKGSFFPSLLEPRRRIDRALLAVIMQVWVEGVSTRSVDEVVKALGIDSGISKSQVSRICVDLDVSLTAFRERPLDHTTFPYLFLDATYVKVRTSGRVVSKAVIIATGVTASGDREVLGTAVGDSEDETFWTDFLRGLRRRGLTGVLLVVSDAHQGLRNAITKVLAGSSWQRCRVHFMRNLLARVPKGSAEMVAATVRTIFAQADSQAVIEQADKVAGMLGRQFPAVETLLRDAAEDLTAFAAFPRPHWRKIWSTNPLERLNREVKRRTNVVGIFPDDNAVLRLVTAVLVEQHDEWQVADRRYLAEGSMAALAAMRDTEPTKEVTANSQLAS